MLSTAPPLRPTPRPLSLPCCALPLLIPAAQAERDYELNRAAELKYGTLLNLQKSLQEAEQDLEVAKVGGGALVGAGRGCWVGGWVGGCCCARGVGACPFPSRPPTHL